MHHVRCGSTYLRVTPLFHQKSICSLGSNIIPQEHSRTYGAGDRQRMHSAYASLMVTVRLCVRCQHCYQKKKHCDAIVTHRQNTELLSPTVSIYLLFGISTSDCVCARSVSKRSDLLRSLRLSTATVVLAVRRALIPLCPPIGVHWCSKIVCKWS